MVYAPSGTLTIGLVNAMPGRASISVERRFTELLRQGAGGLSVHLYQFRLPEVEALPGDRRHCADALSALRPDALIVTGAEPTTPDLWREKFWRSLTGVFDWAEANAISLMASCLAAHAAVLHADGIARRRLPEKCFGLFAHRTAAPHALTAGLKLRMNVPHSRWNDVSEAALRARGYSILSRSGSAGVNLFVRQRNSLFVGVQGHPEYAADTLWGEYRRDMLRFLNGARDTVPRWPQGCLDRSMQDRMIHFSRRAQAERRPELIDEFPVCPSDSAPWRPDSATLFGNWLRHVAALKAARHGPHSLIRPVPIEPARVAA